MPGEKTLETNKIRKMTEEFERNQLFVISKKKKQQGRSSQPE